MPVLGSASFELSFVYEPGSRKKSKQSLTHMHLVIPMYVMFYIGISYAYLSKTVRATALELKNDINKIALDQSRKTMKLY